MSELVYQEQATTVPQQFQRIVQHYGTRPALIEGSACLSYAELDAASDRIAYAIGALLSSGSAPIVIFLEHGSVQISAILAVLKAGFAYCVLDLSFPPERCALILDSLQSPLIITDSCHLLQAEELAKGRCGLLNVDALDAVTALPLPVAPISPDAVAAIFFTSGTTGVPKGVARTQRLLVDVSTRAALEPCEASDIVPLLHSCSFATSTADLYAALLHGAALCIYDLRQHGVQGLADWIQKHQVTRLRVNASVLRQFLDLLPASASFPSVRTVRPTQRLYRYDVERLWRCLPPGATIVHGLASTEAGLLTRLVLQSGELPDGELAPVGRPLPDVEIRLVDASGQPTLPGQVGEMVVSTPNMSPGYWRNPELTAEKFFVDPATNRRFYRLGDLARWRPDGLLELAGRKDFQVKIRGYRVELGEVEAALERIGSLRRCVVVTDSAADGELRLVAYVAPKEAADFNLPDLRRSLTARLPGYMVPAAYVVMEQLPLLSNGKVDRAALPPTSTARPAVEAVYVAPRTPVEATLAAIWGEVLGLEQVGVHDSFLELGGHSLQASRIVSRVVRTFQVHLSLRALFDAPTVAAMALAVTQQTAAKISQDEVERLLAELEANFGVMQAESRLS